MEKYLKYIPLNFSLLAAPSNWVLVFVCIVFASYSIKLLTDDTPKTAD